MRLIVVSFLLFTVAGCAQTASKQKPETDAASTIKDWKTLDDPIYFVQYPESWELNNKGLMGTRFILLSALESPDDKFRESVNLLVQDLPDKNIDLDKYTNISEEQIKTMITNSTLNESKRIKKGDTEYQRIIYTGDQGIFHLKFEQYYFISNEKAYVLTLTTEEAKFEGFKETGEKILNSFRFK